MKPDPAPPRGAAVEVVVHEPRPRRVGPLVVGAGLLAAGAALGSAFGRAPATEQVRVVGAVNDLPIAQTIDTASTVRIGEGPFAPGQERQALRRLEVLFAIDTTGSMGGVLRAAREKVWSIADALASVEPRPELAFGLVAYRDAGDEYLTRYLEPTTDLDAFYAQLQALEARGGGDEPEAIDAALVRMFGYGTGFADPRPGYDPSSSRAPQLPTSRALILIGDAPPHPDRVESTVDLVQSAHRNGVAVHTLYCGEDARTAQLFARLAVEGGGLPQRLDLHPKVEKHTTPFDAEVARLQRTLEATVIPAGTSQEREALQRKVALNSQLDASAWTARASCNSKQGSGYREDLCQQLEEGRATVESIPADQRALAIQRLAERKALRRELTRAVALRDAYLRDTQATTRDPFTRNVLEALLRQLQGC